jgi:hypothetical protein
MMPEQALSSGPQADALGLMGDFLRFEALITPVFLVVVYYVGALILPLIFVLAYRRVRQNVGTRSPFLDHLLQLVRSLSAEAPLRMGLLVFFAFALAELVWRMMIETLIVYFEIGDRLEQLCNCT